MSAAPLPHSLSSSESSRVLEPHHGVTLLGHAAEHLADSRRRVSQGGRVVPVDEAIHILKRLRRGVFEEYAESVQGCGTRIVACH
jgi:hypothetical protein